MRFRLTAAWALMITIQQVDGAKRVEGTVIEAAAYLYARFFFWFRSAEREGEAKN